MGSDILDWLEVVTVGFISYFWWTLFPVVFCMIGRLCDKDSGGLIGFVIGLFVALIAILLGPLLYLLVCLLAEGSYGLDLSDAIIIGLAAIAAVALIGIMTFASIKIYYSNK